MAHTDRAVPEFPARTAVGARRALPSLGKLTSVYVHARDLAPGDFFTERVGRLPNGLPIWRAVEIVSTDNLQKVMHVRRLDTDESLTFPLADKSITKGKKLTAIHANPALVALRGPHWTWIGEGVKA